MTATECLSHPWLTSSTPVVPRTDISANNSTSLDQRLSQELQTPTIILQTATSQNPQSTLTPTSTSSTNTQFYDNHLCDTLNSIPIIATTIPESVPCKFSPATVSTTHLSSPFSSQLAQPHKEEVLPSTHSMYFKNANGHCNNKENLSCNVTFFGINFQTSPDLAARSMATTNLQSSSPKVNHSTPTTPHIFPDAPTTPKVSRKSSPDSPPSVKALVKKFQLAAPECKTTNESPVLASVARRTEFKVDLASATTFNESDCSQRSQDDTSDSLNNCSPLHSSAATTPSTLPSAMPTVIRKPLIVDHGILC